MEVTTAVLIVTDTTTDMVTVMVIITTTKPMNTSNTTLNILVELLSVLSWSTIIALTSQFLRKRSLMNQLKEVLVNNCVKQTIK